MTPKKEKIIIWSIFTPILAYFGVGITCLIFLLVSFFTPTSQAKRDEMTEYYRTAEYLTVYGKIENYYSYSAEVGAAITLKLDEECIASLTEEEYFGSSVSYSFTPTAKKVLQENGFFTLLRTDGDGNIYSEETVTLIVNHKLWEHGDNPVGVGVSVGNTVYLDKETGVELLIDQIQNIMK